MKVISIAALAVATTNAAHVPDRYVDDYHMCTHSIECKTIGYKCCSAWKKDHKDAGFYMLCGNFALSSIYTGAVNDFEYKCNHQGASYIAASSLAAATALYALA